MLSDIKPGTFIEIDPGKDPVTEGRTYLMLIIKKMPYELSFQVINVEQKKISYVTHYAIRSFKEVRNPSEQMRRDAIKGSFRKFKT